MRIRLALPDGHLSPDALNAALEAVTRTNESLLEQGQVPTAAEGIARGVRWKPEPPGDEHFDLANVVIGRGWGDCDDLAPWHAASLRATGKDPGARAVVKRSGPKRWHAVVLRSDGSIDDPSKAAGMGSRRGVNGQGGGIVAPRYSPIVQPLHPGLAAPRIALDVRPWRGGYAGRVDLPLGLAAMASCANAPDPQTCLANALRGAAVVGAACEADPESLLRIAGLHDLVCGEDPEMVWDALSYSSPQLAREVVGFLPAIAAAIPAAGGILNAASSLFGGGGGGGKAPAAPPPAAAAAPGGGGGGFPGGGGGPGWAGAPAWGPVIVRM